MEVVTEDKELKPVGKEQPKPTAPRYVRVLQEDLDKEQNLSKAQIKLLLEDLETFYGERVKHYHAIRRQEL